MLNFEVEAYAYGDESFDMKPTNLIPSKLNRSWTNYDSSIESVLQIFESSMSALQISFFFCFTGIWRHHGEEDWAGAHHWHLRRTDDSRAVQPGGGEARRLLD